MTGPLDLADILAHDRWTNPAPRPGDDLPPYPGPNPPTLPGPCHTPAKACGCGVLDGEDCDCADIAAQLEQANRTPIFFDFSARRAA